MLAFLSYIFLVLASHKLILFLKGRQSGEYFITHAGGYSMLAMDHEGRQYADWPEMLDSWLEKIPNFPPANCFAGTMQKDITVDVVG
jgi:hypothetical protein